MKLIVGGREEQAAGCQEGGRSCGMVVELVAGGQEEQAAGR